MLKDSVNLNGYIESLKFGFDPAAMKDIDITAFGTLPGETIELAGFYDAPSYLRFDARGLVDHPELKRGAPMTLEIDGLPSTSGVVTGRYKQRDGTVHAWGVITG